MSVRSRISGGLGPRGLSIGLGVLWLIDAGLQTQPYMFTRAFAEQVIAPAGNGQPKAIVGSAHWAAHLIATHPALANSTFIGVQLLLGIGLLVRRTERLALIGTVAWSMGIWWFGEGLGGLLGGTGFLAGAPGAALLYAALAGLAWPPRHPRQAGTAGGAVTAVWLGLWATAAAVEIAGPHTPSSAVVAAAAVLIALTCLTPDVALRRFSVALGLSTGLIGWVLVQQFGGLTSGQATDVGTGPVIVLLGLAVLRTTRAPVAAASPALTRASGGREALRVGGSAPR
jgi:hypothetical protein